MSYSSDLTKSWSTPVSIYQVTTLANGYSYSFHALPNYDSSGKVIPIMWSKYAQPSTFVISMANVTFS